MLKGLLLFAAGALVGANLVYFAMSRDAPAVGSASPEPMLAIAREPVPEEALIADDRLDPTLTPALAPPVRRGDDAAQGSRHDDGIDSATADAPDPAVSKLIVPVRGVTRAQLDNTYEDSRGSGRVHEAIDIMAARGTPVLAVADGTVEKLFTSDRGGLTIYQFEPSGRYAYYYAHLDHYADDLEEDDALKQGEVIGYVGSTGNASDDAPHLHFGIFELTPERQWWKGTAINPYPVLKAR